MGRYNFLKYGHLYARDLSEAKVVSDDVYRTIMSGNAEVLGMLHEINKDKYPMRLTEKQLANLSLPQFHVRNISKIKEELG